MSGFDATKVPTKDLEKILTDLEKAKQNLPAFHAKNKSEIKNILQADKELQKNDTIIGIKKNEQKAIIEPKKTKKEENKKTETKIVKIKKNDKKQKKEKTKSKIKRQDIPKTIINTENTTTKMGFLDEFNGIITHIKKNIGEIFSGEKNKINTKKEENKKGLGYTLGDILGLIRPEYESSFGETQEEIANNNKIFQEILKGNYSNYQQLTRLNKMIERKLTDNINTYDLMKLREKIINNNSIFKEIAEGNYNNIKNLTRLNKKIYTMIVKNIKEFDIIRIKQIDKEVATELAKNEGDLRLGLNSITKEIAKELVKHKGKLYLKFLEEVDDEVLEILVKHKGRICFSDTNIKRRWNEFLEAK